MPLQAPVLLAPSTHPQGRANGKPAKILRR